MTEREACTARVTCCGSGDLERLAEALSGPRMVEQHLHCVSVAGSYGNVQRRTPVNLSSRVCMRCDQQPCNVCMAMDAAGMEG